MWIPQQSTVDPRKSKETQGNVPLCCPHVLKKVHLSSSSFSQNEFSVCSGANLRKGFVHLCDRHHWHADPPGSSWLCRLQPYRVAGRVGLSARLSYSPKTLSQLNCSSAGLAPTFLLSYSQWWRAVCFSAQFLIKFNHCSLNLMRLKILWSINQNPMSTCVMSLNDHRSLQLGGSLWFLVTCCCWVISSDRCHVELSLTSNPAFSLFNAELCFQCYDSNDASVTNIWAQLYCTVSMVACWHQHLDWNHCCAWL